MYADEAIGVNGKGQRLHLYCSETVVWFWCFLLSRASVVSLARVYDSSQRALHALAFFSVRPLA